MASIPEAVKKGPVMTMTLKSETVSMDFMLQEHGVPHDGPKDSNAGGCKHEILDRNETQ
jgi:hypothetical protein